MVGSAKPQEIRATVHQILNVEPQGQFLENKIDYRPLESFIGDLSELQVSLKMLATSESAVHPNEDINDSIDRFQNQISKVEVKKLLENLVFCRDLS